MLSDVLVQKQHLTVASLLSASLQPCLHVSHVVTSSQCCESQFRIMLSHVLSEQTTYQAQRHIRHDATIVQNEGGRCSTQVIAVLLSEFAIHANIKGRSN